MADGVNDPVRATEERAADPPLGGSVGLSRERGGTRRESSPHAHKFRAATALLVGFALGALVVAGAILASHKGHTSSVAWSAWKPPDSGTAGATEIADHLAPLYRISDINQLAVVTVVNLANANAAAAQQSSGTTTTAPGGLQVAVRTDPRSSAVSLLTGNTIAFNLCGIGGSNCSIGVGTPSTSRLLLLRREALELALYTFKYLSGTQNVVAILPPGYTTQACIGLCPKPNQRSTTKPTDIALLFLHDELQPWLSQPLNQTLPETFPPSAPQMSAAPEAGLVDQITARGLFSENVEQAQDGSNLIVLNPLPPQ
jgi:hypothetical protein